MDAVLHGYALRPRLPAGVACGVLKEVLELRGRGLAGVLPEDALDVGRLQAHAAVGAEAFRRRRGPVGGCGPRRGRLADAVPAGEDVGLAHPPARPVRPLRPGCPAGPPVPEHLAVVPAACAAGRAGLALRREGRRRLEDLTRRHPLAHPAVAALRIRACSLRLALPMDRALPAAGSRPRLAAGSLVAHVRRAGARGRAPHGLHLRLEAGAHRSRVHAVARAELPGGRLPAEHDVVHHRLGAPVGQARKLPDSPVALRRSEGQAGRLGDAPGVEGAHTDAPGEAAATD
mmetsp:Transcript_44296/g.137972  ORF Transcript_44296/g.137972 Transcript_44296/m.137972 type:complete len:288 (+) Transcript_44296:1010-1873(+)